MISSGNQAPDSAETLIDTMTTAAISACSLVSTEASSSPRLDATSDSAIIMSSSAGGSRR